MPRKQPGAPAGLRPGADASNTVIRRVTRSELARRAGKAKSRISEDCSPGGLLAPACVLGGDVDLTHPAVAEWARRRRVDPARLEAPQESPPKDATTRQTAAADLTPAGEYDALTLRKKRAEVERLELRNARDQGRAVSFELVRTLVLTHLNTLHLRLLREGADYLAGMLLAAAKSGESREALVERIRVRIGQDLAAANRSSLGGLKQTVRASKGSGELPDVTEASVAETEDLQSRARRSALRLARAELLAVVPNVVQHVVKGVGRGASASDLERTIATIAGAAIDKAGRPNHQQEERT